jgi:hypothetical protein
MTAVLIIGAVLLFAASCVALVRVARFVKYDRIEWTIHRIQYSECGIELPPRRPLWDYRDRITWLAIFVSGCILAVAIDAWWDHEYALAAFETGAWLLNMGFVVSTLVGRRQIRELMIMADRLQHRNDELEDENSAAVAEIFREFGEEP